MRVLLPAQLQYPSPDVQSIHHRRKSRDFDPFAIERRIRCETQVALQDKAIALLKAEPRYVRIS